MKRFRAQSAGRLRFPSMAPTRALRAGQRQHPGSCITQRIFFHGLHRLNERKGRRRQGTGPAPSTDSRSGAISPAREGHSEIEAVCIRENPWFKIPAEIGLSNFRPPRHGNKSTTGRRLLRHSATGSSKTFLFNRL